MEDEDEFFGSEQLVEEHELPDLVAEAGLELVEPVHVLLEVGLAHVAHALEQQPARVQHREVVREQEGLVRRAVVFK